MRAMIMRGKRSLTDTTEPLDFCHLPAPTIGRGEVLIRVHACGVCHTELDEIEGRTMPPHLPVVLGHEVVGRVAAVGPGVTQWTVGERVGVGWIHSSSGEPDENLSPQFLATGRDVNGGYAEYMKAAEDYTFRIPDTFSDEQAAPLLCAGAIGFRALKLCQLRDGDRLGLTGFGGSAHLVLQLARHQFPGSEIYVFARDASVCDFALGLGADWAGPTDRAPPHPLQAIIDTTPAWFPVVQALKSLRPGGRLVINAIRKEAGDQDSLMQLKYEEHLWMEREIKSVANITAADIRDFLPLAAEIPLRPRVTTYPLEAANEALISLKQGRIRGAKVLVMT